MSGAVPQADAKALTFFIDPALLSWLNGHVQRLDFQRLIEHRTPVTIVPNTERDGIAGSGEVYVTISDGRKQCRIQRRFLKTSAELQEMQRQERQQETAGASGARAAGRPRRT